MAAYGGRQDNLVRTARYKGQASKVPQEKLRKGFVCAFFISHIQLLTLASTNRYLRVKAFLHPENLDELGFS